MRTYIKSVQSFYRHIHSFFSSSLIFGTFCVHATVEGYACMLLCLYFLCKFLVKHSEAQTLVTMQFAHKAPIHTFFLRAPCLCAIWLSDTRSKPSCCQPIFQQCVSVAVRHSLPLGTVPVEQHVDETLFPLADCS